MTNWEHRAKVAEAEVERLRERLQIDPGGSDRIDELEMAMQFLKHRAEVAEKGLKMFGEFKHRLHTLEKYVKRIDAAVGEHDNRLDRLEKK